MKQTAVILCVDDDPSIQRLIARILSGTGWEYTLITAVDGRQAMNAFNTHNVGLVLLDVNLPVASGVEVCRHIRNTNAQVPILAMSANAANRESVLSAGATIFLDKPFSPGALVISLAKFLPTPVATEHN